MQFKLGLTAKKEDSRTLKMENYLYLPQLPTPPEECDWTVAGDACLPKRIIKPTDNFRASIVSEDVSEQAQDSVNAKLLDEQETDWGVYLNDRYGICGPAGAAHADMVWSSSVGQIYKPDERQILLDYSSISGFDSRTGTNDNGVNMLDMFRYWRTNGIGGKRIHAFASIKPRAENTHAMIIASIWLFGGVAFGIRLPKLYDPSRYTSREWLAPSSNYHLNLPLYKPGGLGGHYVPFFGYTAKRIRGVTWGYEQLMSWNAVNTYVDEIMVPFSESWFNGEKKAPNGFDLDTLIADLKAIR